MIEYILLVILAAIVVAQLFLRTNTAVAFFAVCTGSVLVAFSGDNMGLIASSLTSGMSSASNIAKIVLLFLPLLVVAIIMRGQVHKALLPLNILPAVCVSLAGLIFLYPLLDASIKTQIDSTETWQLITQYRELIIGIGIVSSVVLLAFTSRRPKDKHHKKHGH